jgi:hypothetical protein
LGKKEKREISPSITSMVMSVGDIQQTYSEAQCVLPLELSTVDSWARNVATRRPRPFLRSSLPHLLAGPGRLPSFSGLYASLPSIQRSEARRHHLPRDRPTAVHQVSPIHRSTYVGLLRPIRPPQVLGWRVLVMSWPVAVSGTQALSSSP